MLLLSVHMMHMFCDETSRSSGSPQLLGPMLNLWTVHMCVWFANAIHCAFSKLESCLRHTYCLLTKVLHELHQVRPACECRLTTCHSAAGGHETSAGGHQTSARMSEAEAPSRHVWVSQVDSALPQGLPLQSKAFTVEFCEWQIFKQSLNQLPHCWLAEDQIC